MSQNEKQILENASTKFEDKYKLLEAIESQRNDWSKDQRAKFKEIKYRFGLMKRDPNLAGSRQEEEVYKKLRSALERLQVKDTVVINGWNIKRKCEFDFLIVSEPLKTIFHVEVKLTYSGTERKRAEEQLQKGRNLFQSEIPFPQQEEWKYVGIIYFGFDRRRNKFESSASPYCQELQLFVLGSETDFEAWWQEISSKLTETLSKHLNRNSYVQIVQFLCCQMYQQKCFTTQGLLNYTEEMIDKISSPEKLFFWSKIQYSLFYDAGKKRMIFTSSFGTGKTVLLKAKAKALLDYGQKVAFVFVGESPKETLLQMQYRAEFQESQNWVTFHNITCEGK